MAAPTHQRTLNHRCRCTLNHRLTVVLLTALPVLLMSYGALAVSVASASGLRSVGASLCGDSHDMGICASAVAYASSGEAEEGDEELEEGEAEAASSEARSEEAGWGAPESPSTHTSSPTTDPGRQTSLAVVSQLRLTTKAVAALAQRDPYVSTIVFSLRLSAPAKLRVTLVKQISGHRPMRWTVFSGSVAFEAARGHVSHALTGHDKLFPGRYRLTVKPAGGTSRSIYLTSGRGSRRPSGGA